MLLHQVAIALHNAALRHAAYMSNRTVGFTLTTISPFQHSPHAVSIALIYIVVNFIARFLGKATQRHIPLKHCRHLRISRRGQKSTLIEFFHTFTSGFIHLIPQRRQLSTCRILGFFHQLQGCIFYVFEFGQLFGGHRRQARVVFLSILQILFTCIVRTDSIVHLQEFFKAAFAFLQQSTVFSVSCVFVVSSPHATCFTRILPLSINRVTHSKHAVSLKSMFEHEIVVHRIALFFLCVHFVELAQMSIHRIEFVCQFLWQSL